MIVDTQDTPPQKPGASQSSMTGRTPGSSAQNMTHSVANSVLSISSLNLAVAIGAVLIIWRQAASASADLILLSDFKYFWQAGHMWAAGQSPYLPDYITEGAKNFGDFANPFFYPPNALPFLSLAAPFSPRDVANGLTLISLACLFGVTGLITQASKRISTRIPPVYIFIILIIFAAFYMRPSIRVLMYGQITWVLALGFAAYFYGLFEKRNICMAIGLTILLLKPQFGLPVLAFALIRPESRLPALTAGAATGFLGVAGLLTGDPVENARQLLLNISVYSSLPENNPAASGGLNQLYNFIKVDPPKVVQLLIALAPVVILARYARRQAAAGAAACAALVCGFLAFPTHSTDFILLLPAALYLLSSAPLWTRGAIGLAFLLLGRSWSLADFITPPHLDHAITVGHIHTIGLVLLFTGLCRAAFHVHDVAKPGARHANNAHYASLPAA